MKITQHDARLLPSVLNSMLKTANDNADTTYYLLNSMTSKRNCRLGYSRSAHAGCAILASVHFDSRMGKFYGQIAWKLLGIERLSEQARNLLYKCELPAGSFDNLFCADA